jgi:hypothetical protein
VPGAHYVEATLDAMPEVVGRYLADEPARAAIASAGNRFVTTGLRHEDCVARIVELIRG